MRLLEHPWQYVRLSNFNIFANLMSTKVILLFKFVLPWLMWSQASFGIFIGQLHSLLSSASLCVLPIFSYQIVYHCLTQFVGLLYMYYILCLLVRLHILSPLEVLLLGSKKAFSVPRSQSCSLTCSTNCLIFCFCFSFRSLIRLEFIFESGVR